MEKIDACVKELNPENILHLCSCLLLSPGWVAPSVVLLWLREISSLWRDRLPAPRSRSESPPLPLQSAGQTEFTQSAWWSVNSQITRCCTYYLWPSSDCISVLMMIMERRGSYLVICTDGPQLHDELETEEVVGPDGLQLQETAESHQLRSGQVVQSQVILEQFGEFQDLLITGTFPGVPDLPRWIS